MNSPLSTIRLTQARRLFTNPLAPRAVQRHNMRAWVRSLRLLGNKWRLASPVRSRPEPAEPRFLNACACPRCHHAWYDEWSALCNDECPACGLNDIEPEHSTDVSSFI